MHAYYEIDIDIPVNRQLHLQLPDTIPAGRAKIAVIYEVANMPDHSAESGRGALHAPITTQPNQ